MTPTQPITTTGVLEELSYEVRAEREKQLLSEIDDRPALERLFDRLLSARLTHYRPDQPPTMRQDIVCWCCGYPYRPDDVMDAENVFLCATCILSRKENEEPK